MIDSVEKGILLHVATSAGLAGKPLVLAAPFTQGIDKLIPVGKMARGLLEKMCPPSSDAHSWTSRGSFGMWGLLVERRYANDLVAAIRRRGAVVP